MPRSPKRLLKTLPNKRDVLFFPALALRSVTSKSGAGVYASSDTLFKGAIFGRDSLEVAEDLMDIKPKLVWNILTKLASLQGIEANSLNEEEPGKIIHEYRSVIVDGKHIDDASMSIFQDLSAKWGGNEQELAYYGSVDATPHFLRTLGFYSEKYGGVILDKKVTLRNGTSATVKEVALQAAEWVTERLSNSRSGLLEYRRVNPHGISNQVWKDSEEFYVHENSQMANHNAPVSSIEVQGLAYDGLMAAARFFPEKEVEFRGIAERLRDTTIKLLWQKDRQNFALGTDYDDKGRLRTINTLTANPAVLLDTGFFEGLDSGSQQKYISSLTESILSADFLTDAGIRSRALTASHLVEFWDYHGSYVSWPKETYDIAKGMRRQGLHELGAQLENRIINVILKNREYPEFVYVDHHGRVMASSPSPHTHGELTIVDSTNKPESIQAWTVSAVYAILTKRLSGKFQRAKKPPKEEWKRELQKTVLARMPIVDWYINPFALSARYPTYRYRLEHKG